jgi:hypothetical protein
MRWRCVRVPITTTAHETRRRRGESPDRFPPRHFCGWAFGSSATSDSAYSASSLQSGGSQITGGNSFSGTPRCRYRNARTRQVLFDLPTFMATSATVSASCQMRMNSRGVTAGRKLRLRYIPIPSTTTAHGQRRLHWGGYRGRNKTQVPHAAWISPDGLDRCKNPLGTRVFLTCCAEVRGTHIPVPLITAAWHRRIWPRIGSRSNCDRLHSARPPHRLHEQDRAGAVVSRYAILA